MKKLVEQEINNKIFEGLEEKEKKKGSFGNNFIGGFITILIGIHILNQF
jgi:hypothetical protein